MVKKTKNPPACTSCTVHARVSMRIYFTYFSRSRQNESLLHFNRTGGLIFAIPGISRAIAHFRTNRFRSSDFPILQSKTASKR
jgi:hypothetical protein